MTHTLTADQVWTARDPRFVRHVRVIAHNVQFVTVATCDEHGEALKRTSCVRRDRFERAFKYLRDAGA